MNGILGEFLGTVVLILLGGIVVAAAAGQPHAAQQRVAVIMRRRLHVPIAVIRRIGRIGRIGRNGSAEQLALSGGAGGAGSQSRCWGWPSLQGRGTITKPSLALGPFNPTFSAGGRNLKRCGPPA